VAWNGFSDDSVTVITKAPKKVSEFVVVDPGTDEVITRPVGTDGDDDRPADRDVAQNVRKRALAVRGGGGAAADAPSTAAEVDDSTVGTDDQNTVAPDAGEQPDASIVAVPSGEPSRPNSVPGTGGVVGTGPGTDVEPVTDPATGPAAGTNPDTGAGPDPDVVLVDPEPGPVVDAVVEPTG
jgi:hypothetical protein